jgi:Domain of unknown function (DUF4440)
LGASFGDDMPGAVAAAIAAAWQRTRRWGWIGVIAAAVLFTVFADSKSQPKAPRKPDEAPLLAADAALGQAMRAGDRRTARRLLSLEFSFVDPAGKVYARRALLADLKDMAAAPASEAKARNYGLLATVTGERKNASSREVFFLDVWVRQKRAWRALAMQEVNLSRADAPPAQTAGRASTAAPTAPAAASATRYACKNPCLTIPYRVRSPAEQDVITAYQAIVKAIVAHDAPEWDTHVADDFVLYASNRAPVAKAERIAAIERQKATGAAVTVGEIADMHLAVYGDGAAMLTTEASPDLARAYHAARIFVHRNGQWLMALSAHTDAE